MLPGWTDFRCAIAVLAVLLTGLACADQSPTRASAEAVTAQAGTPLEGTPKLAIQSPTPFQYFTVGTQPLPVTMVWTLGSWGTFPAPGKDLRFFLDGVYQGAVTTLDPFVFPELPFGQHNLTVQAWQDGLPLSGAKATVTVRARKVCTPGDSCDDHNPCSLSACQESGTQWLCAFGNPVGDQCCLSDLDCPTEVPRCHAALPGGRPFCAQCLTDLACDDGLACTADSCVDGQCLPSPLGECGSDQDCDDGDLCTQDSCAQDACTCVHQRLQGCCTTDLQCDDADPCTIQSCLGHVCRYGPRFLGQVCCTDDSVCTTPNPCFQGACFKDPKADAGYCVVTPNPLATGCCDSTQDCDDGNACTIDACSAEGLCSNQPREACCRFASECDDGDPCSRDLCVANACRHGPLLPGQDCCATDADCQPEPGSCVLGTCLREGAAGVGVCQFDRDPARPLCCTSDANCPAGDPSTVGQCPPAPEGQERTCVFLPNPEWCGTPPEAPPVINEVLVDPFKVPDSRGEWVELFNPSPKAQTLTGWYLSSAEGIPCSLSGRTLAPFGFLVAARNGDPALNGGVVADVVCGSALVLLNLDSQVRLHRPGGVVVDQLRWGFDTGLKPSPGAALGRLTPLNLEGQPVQWRSSVKPLPGGDKGSPGAHNVDLGFEPWDGLCSDSNGCTLDLCSVSTEAFCTHLPRQSCCVEATDCDDGHACTRDLCDPSTGLCAHEAMVG